MVGLFILLCSNSEVSIYLCVFLFYLPSICQFDWQLKYALKMAPYQLLDGQVVQNFASAAERRQQHGTILSSGASMGAPFHPGGVVGVSDLRGVRKTAVGVVTRW